jgi:hypothetical protein
MGMDDEVNGLKRMLVIFFFVIPGLLVIAAVAALMANRMGLL